MRIRDGKGIVAASTHAPDLHEEYAVDEVEHVDDGGHGGRLDVQRRGVRVSARVRLRQPLLQHHRLLREVAQALRRLARLLVLLAELRNVHELVVTGQGDEQCTR